MTTPDQATRTQIANIERATGRGFAAWIETVRASGLARHGEIVALLKRDHGFTHGNANLVALRALDEHGSLQDDEALIMSHYAGKNAGLRPLYDRVIAGVRDFGPDIELAPKKTYVSLRRRKQFAQVGPATGGRLEIGLNLPDAPVAGRLEAASGMVNRRVRIQTLDEIDGGILGWLREAYEGA
ncbi:MAG: DUF5655 domain-containing protein [Chloroflexota bacterium]